MSRLNFNVTQLQFGYQQPLYAPLTFQCHQGEIMTVLGMNGQGKTALLLSLINALPILSGSIQRKGQIGFVPQFFHSPDYKVLDIVLMGRAKKIGLFALPTKTDITIASQMLSRLSIAHLAQENFNRLSGGQRQLVLIAQVLASECDVLILDEPTAALDLHNQQRVLNLMQDLAAEQQISVIFSSHDPNHALYIADNVLLLLPNQQWLYGKTDQILTEVNLAQAYCVNIKYGKIDNRPILAPIFQPTPRK